MYSRQFMRWLRITQTTTLRRVIKTRGASQLGLRTMSSNVLFGEKNTPSIRATAPIEGCGSGDIGAAIVTIKDSSTTDLGSKALLPVLRVTERDISVAAL